MRDMNIVSNTRESSGKLVRGPLPPTPDQELAARMRLLQSLQTTLEPRELLERFWQHCQILVPLGGLRLVPRNGDTIHLGHKGLHQCHYNLKGDQGELGEISFSRSKRFTADELSHLEELLGLLVYPLRNAIQYQLLARLSLRDSLTGLGNRAALDAALKHELQLAHRHEFTVSLLLIDLDHFKLINDTWGHSTGDRVLQAIAETISSVCRSSDISFRYGGEEFVVLLRNTDSSGARIIAERIRRQVALQTLEGKINPTVSIGIGTCVAGNAESADQLFDRADQALYGAKHNGRNRIQAG